MVFVFFSSQKWRQSRSSVVWISLFPVLNFNVLLSNRESEICKVGFPLNGQMEGGKKTDIEKLILSIYERE